MSKPAPSPGLVVDRNLALELVRVTEAAALAASPPSRARFSMKLFKSRTISVMLSSSPSADWSSPQYSS